MWIEETANHHFKFVEQFKDPLSDNYRRVSITFDRKTSHTRKEAQLVLAKKIDQKLREVGTPVTDFKIILLDVVHQWLNYFRQRVKFNTYRNNVSRAKHIVIAFGKDTIISRITPSLLTNYFGWIIE